MLSIYLSYISASFRTWHDCMKFHGCSNGVENATFQGEELLLAMSSTNLIEDEPDSKILSVRFIRVSSAHFPLKINNLDTRRDMHSYTDPLTHR